MTVAFHGPAVIVDDSLDNPSGALREILEQLEGAGLPLIKFNNLPDVSVLPHWQQLGLIVLDWEMSYSDGVGEETMPSGITVPDALSEDSTARVCDFVRELLSQVYAPVFIMSNEAPERIREELDTRLADIKDVVARRVGVYSKTEAQVNVLETVGTWISRKPALLALKMWTDAYLEAARSTFVDFEAASGDWIGAIVSAARADGVRPSTEISEVISANVASRMARFQFEAPDGGDNVDGESLRQVLHLRAVVPASRLESGEVGSGDIYVVAGVSEPYPEILVVVTPDCDLVRSERVRITVVPATPASSSGTSRKRVERLRKAPEGHVLTTALTPTGAEYDVSLSRWSVHDFKVEEDDPWPGHVRIGRLMDPYLTSLQQRYGLHVTRKGLPAIPETFYD